MPWWKRSVDSSDPGFWMSGESTVPYATGLMVSMRDPVGLSLNNSLATGWMVCHWDWLRRRSVRCHGAVRTVEDPRLVPSSRVMDGTNRGVLLAIRSRLMSVRGGGSALMGFANWRHGSPQSGDLDRNHKVKPLPLPHQSRSELWGQSSSLPSLEAFRGVRPGRPNGVISHWTRLDAVVPTS
jgi:hypothetical protein